MKIFLSWSGDRSGEVASALRDWFPTVLQAVQPYYSPEDTVKGTRWSTEVAKHLDESEAGIICLTPENLSSPWILFEAGALSTRFQQSRICTLLLGLTPADVKGPLSQFQATLFDKEDVRNLVEGINEALAEQRLLPNTLQTVFEAFWPALESSVNRVFTKASERSGGPKRSDRELLEEMLEILRHQSPARASQSRLSPEIVQDLIIEFTVLMQSLEATNSDLLSRAEHWRLQRQLVKLMNAAALPSYVRAELTDLLAPYDLQK